MCYMGLQAHLDLPEVHRLADELVVLGQLLAGGQHDEDLTQLTAIDAGTGEMQHKVSKQSGQ